MIEETKRARINRLTDFLRKRNFTKIQYYICHTLSFEDELKCGKWKDRKIADEWIYAVEAEQEGKYGKTYFTQPDHWEEIALCLEETAKVYSRKYIPVELPLKEKISKKEKSIWKEDGFDEISYCLEKAQKAAMSFPGVLQVRQCKYQQKLQEIFLIKENEAELSDQTAYHYFEIDVIAGSPERKESASGRIYGDSIAGMDVESCAKETAFEAIKRIGSKPLFSGQYNVILFNHVMAELVEAYLPAFYLRNVLDERSPLTEKNGIVIADRQVLIKEDPFYSKGAFKRSWDDEGRKVSKKYLLRNGKVECLLADRQTAAEGKVEPTGNGFKTTLQSEAETGVTNIVFDGTNSVSSLDSLKKQMKHGLLITEIDGVFAGANWETGDFSLIAKGRIVDEGKETDPFSKITIAGNFFDILKNNLVIAVDHAVTPPYLKSVSAPSVFVGELTVSGK
ncbi:MAG: metallopeptidase TldD-related protein [Lachnospiraceae bacterium]|nr:metallopeptidase TldD-related protein [Lachnospiraceae bacterium]